MCEFINLLLQLTVFFAFFALCPRVLAQDRDNKRTVNPPMIVSTFTADPGAKYPFRQNMYEPLALPDGRIMALSVARRDGQQTMQARYSTDEGRTWTQPEDLFDFPRQAGGFALFERLLDRNGELHIFILGDANSGMLFPTSEEAAPTRQGEILEIWHVKSRDKMQHWGKPQRISEVGDDLLSVIQIRNGRIVLPFDFKRLKNMDSPRQGFEAYTYCGTYGVTTVYSDDDGDTWQRSPDTLIDQTPDLDTYGLNEPAMLQLNDGRVWMLMRTQRGRFYESFSSDGIHWSAPEASKLISSDSPAGLMRLKDGSILLFSNACLRYPYAYGGRYVLHGAISPDEGRTWRGFRELLRDPHRNEPIHFWGDYGYSYSFPTLTQQGNVLFTNWVETGNGMTRAFKLLDPAWLYQMRQETDFSGGLDDWSIFGSKGVELTADPEKSNAQQVLGIRKADPAWPAAAVWNFPMGAKGTLKLKLMMREGFGGIRLGLTDHFSVPWDDEDKFYNVFNLEISPDGQMMPVGDGKLLANKWQELQLDWSTEKRQCRVTLDGKQVGTLQDSRRSDGLNYVRFRSTASNADRGLLVAHVSADVSASWPQTPPDLHAAAAAGAAEPQAAQKPQPTTAQGTAKVEPTWPQQATHRLLVRIDAIDNGNRRKEGMVAAVHVDFTSYCKRAVDLSSLLVQQYDPSTGQIIDLHNNAFARLPGDLPMRFYDDQVPYDFPKHQGYVDHQTGEVPDLVHLEGWGRLFNTTGDARGGQIAWAHMQRANQPAYYQISFKELEPGAPQWPAPAGFIGDGSNRCLPEGDFAPIIHGHLALGDLSGTGLTDIVLGHEAGTLLWYPNHGTATQPRYDTCSFLRTDDGNPIDVGWSSAPELVDWDGDGLLDLIIGAEHEAVLFYKNVGDRRHPVFRNMGLLKLADGTILRPPHTPCDADPQNKIFTQDYEVVPHVVDWKGSGKLDLMLGGYITGRIFYYENVAPSRKYPPQLIYRGPLQADGKDLDVGWCAWPCTGDFRNTGKLDLITGALQLTAGIGDKSDPDKFMIYYENVGTRQNPVLHQVPFPANTRFPYGMLASPRAADLYHNGRLDLVVAVNNKLHIYPNIGSATKPLFDATVKPLHTVWGNAADLPWDGTYFDFSRHGFPDVFDQDHILINSGRGSPGIFDKIVTLPGAKQIDHPAARGDPWHERALADLDGDGKRDILAADNDGYIWFHRNIGTEQNPRFDSNGERLKLNNGQFVKAGIPHENAHLFDVLQGARCMIAVLHIDHSAPADAALSDTYGKIRLFLHDPSVKPGDTPRFLPPTILPEPNAPRRLSVRRVDWNHDGWDDLLYAYGDSEFYVLLNESGPDGRRHLGQPRKLKVPHGCVEAFVSVVDWNNDGDNDLIIDNCGFDRLVEQSFIEHGYIPGQILSAQSRQ